MDVYKQLEKIYYDPQKGFVSADKLYKVARQYNINCTQKDVNNFLDNTRIFRVNQQTAIFILKVKRKEYLLKYIEQLQKDKGDFGGLGVVYLYYDRFERTSVEIEEIRAYC